jgi:photosystem II stability/assembly factor-like uncharacterized protein
MYTNGGASWQRIEAPIAKEVYSLFSNKADSLLAIAFDGKLLYSSDRGSSWAFQQLWYQPYKFMNQLPNGRLFLAGGVSFSLGYSTITSVGGPSDPETTWPFELNALQMATNSEGYMVGYGVVLKTKDGGISWQECDLANENFSAVTIDSAGKVLVCGFEGSIFLLSRGDGAWRKTRNGNDISQKKYHLLDICWLDNRRALTCGESGTILYSDDEGEHWSQIECSSERTMRKISIRSSKETLVCADGGYLYHIYW